MTVLVTATALAAGVGDRTVLLATAVLVGQLSVGWSNDAIDAPLDQAAGRTDKPIATGAVSRHLVARSATVALVVDVPLSLALGLRPGVEQLVVVLLAWSYNAGLKRTIASAVPYVLAFGLLPAVVVAAMLPGRPWPHPALVVAGSCCGLAGHFANTIGDATEDRLTGVRGLPQRIGPARSTIVAGVLIAVASLAIITAVGARPLTISAAAVDVAIAGSLPALTRGSTARPAAFVAVLVAVAVLLVAFIGSGGSHLASGH